MNKYGNRLKLRVYDLHLLCQGLAKGLRKPQSGMFCRGLIQNFLWDWNNRDGSLRITQQQFDRLREILKRECDYRLNLTGKAGYDRYASKDAQVMQVETFLWDAGVNLNELFPDRFEEQSVQGQAEPDPLEQDRLKSLEFRVRRIERLLQDVMEE